MYLITYILTGPIVGGVIAESEHWRWIYLFNAPVAAVVLVPFLMAWPKTVKGENRNRSLFLREVDIIGAVVLLAASTLLLFALQQVGGANFTWSSPTTIATLTVSGVCWIAFIIWIVILEYGHMKLKVKPIFPLSVAISRPTGSAIL